METFLARGVLSNQKKRCHPIPRQWEGILAYRRLNAPRVDGAQLSDTELCQVSSETDVFCSSPPQKKNEKQKQNKKKNGDC